jgi:hypothetical protein
MFKWIKSLFCKEEVVVISDRRRWSEEEEETLIRLYKDGIELSRIADMLGRTETAVYVKKNRLLREENDTTV